MTDEHAALYCRVANWRAAFDRIARALPAANPKTRRRAAATAALLTTPAPSPILSPMTARTTAGPPTDSGSTPRRVVPAAAGADS